jgi:SH3-like domain-containing protein
MSGQGEAETAMSARAWAPIFAAVLFWSLGAVEMAVAADRPTPSGLPVPRYVVLKFGEVNARAGPGDDHRLLWVYRVKGLPVQVVAENTEWRRICDPERGLAWVHRRTTDGRRMVMRTQATPLALRGAPKPTAAVHAFLNARALAALVRCDSKAWCKLRVDGVSGWAPASELWGTDDRPQCR